jgi:hypothetical protein
VVEYCCLMCSFVPLHSVSASKLPPARILTVFYPPPPSRLLPPPSVSPPRVLSFVSFWQVDGVSSFDSTVNPSMISDPSMGDMFADGPSYENEAIRRFLTADQSLPRCA